MSAFNLPPESNTIDEQIPAIFEDAHRLIEKKEYSASIIIAYSSLEAFLKSSKVLPPTDSLSSFFNSQSVLSKYGENSKSPVLNLETGRKFLDARNRIAHDQYSATKKEADEYLSFAETIVKEILG